jgi:hypothetical protein
MRSFIWKQQKKVARTLQTFGVSWFGLEFELKEKQPKLLIIAFVYHSVCYLFYDKSRRKTRWDLG